MSSLFVLTACLGKPDIIANGTIKNIEVVEWAGIALQVSETEYYLVEDKTFTELDVGTIVEFEADIVSIPDLAGKPTTIKTSKWNVIGSE